MNGYHEANCNPGGDSIYARHVCWFRTALAVALAILMASCNRSPVAPPIERETERSLGILFPEEIRSHVFTLKNHLDKEIRGLRIRTSCACTKGHLEKSLLRPGEATAVKVMLRARNSSGPMKEQIVVTGNTDESPAIVRVFLRAEVADVVELSDGAKYIELAESGTGECGLEATLTIKRGSHPMKWDELRCKSDDPNLKCRLLQIGSDTWQLHVSRQRPEYSGIIREHFELSFFNHGRQLDYRLVRTVLAETTGPAFVSPKTLLLGAVSKGDKVTRELKLGRSKNETSTPLRILSIRSSHPRLLTADTAARNQEPVICITFLAGGDAGRIEGDIAVIVALDKRYEIRVPYLAMVVE